MWFYKGVKVNILATTQKKTIVALIYKINPVQITTFIAENTENLLNLVPYTTENIQLKNCEIFSPIVKVKLALFVKCHGYCYTNSVNCSHAKHQKDSN